MRCEEYWASDQWSKKRKEVAPKESTKRFEYIEEKGFRFFADRLQDVLTSSAIDLTYGDIDFLVRLLGTRPWADTNLGFPLLSGDLQTATRRWILRSIRKKSKTSKNNGRVKNDSKEAERLAPLLWNPPLKKSGEVDLADGDWERIAPLGAAISDGRTVWLPSAALQNWSMSAPPGKPVLRVPVSTVLRTAFRGFYRWLFERSSLSPLGAGPEVLWLNILTLILLLGSIVALGLRYTHLSQTALSWEGRVYVAGGSPLFENVHAKLFSEKRDIGYPLPEFMNGVEAEWHWTTGTTWTPAGTALENPESHTRQYWFGIISGFYDRPPKGSPRLSSDLMRLSLAAHGGWGGAPEWCRKLSKAIENFDEELRPVQLLALLAAHQPTGQIQDDECRTVQEALQKSWANAIRTRVGPHEMELLDGLLLWIRQQPDSTNSPPAEILTALLPAVVERTATVRRRPEGTTRLESDTYREYSRLSHVQEAFPKTAWRDQRISDYLRDKFTSIVKRICEDEKSGYTSDECPIVSAPIDEGHQSGIRTPLAPNAGEIFRESLDLFAQSNSTPESALFASRVLLELRPWLDALVRNQIATHENGGSQDNRPSDLLIQVLDKLQEDVRIIKPKGQQRAGQSSIPTDDTLGVDLQDTVWSDEEMLLLADVATGLTCGGAAEPPSSDPTRSDDQAMPRLVRTKQAAISWLSLELRTESSQTSSATSVRRHLVGALRWVECLDKHMTSSEWRQIKEQLTTRHVHRLQMRELEEAAWTALSLQSQYSGVNISNAPLYQTTCTRQGNRRPSLATLSALETHPTLASACLKDGALPELLCPGDFGTSSFQQCFERNAEEWASWREGIRSRWSEDSGWGLDLYLHALPSKSQQHMSEETILGAKEWVTRRWSELGLPDTRKLEATQESSRREDTSSTLRALAIVIARAMGQLSDDVFFTDVETFASPGESITAAGKDPWEGHRELRDQLISFLGEAFAQKLSVTPAEERTVLLEGWMEAIPPAHYALLHYALARAVALESYRERPINGLAKLPSASDPFRAAVGEAALNPMFYLLFYSPPPKD